MAGSVMHFELPADDVKRAVRFYEAVFGWKPEAVPEMEYTLVRTTPSDTNGRPKGPGAINGGILRRQGFISAPVVTLEVPQIESALKDVRRHGGKVVQEKTPVGDIGFSAYFHDPEGNLVGLWTRAPE